MSLTAEQNKRADITDDMIYDSLETISAYANMGRTAIYYAIKHDGFPEPYQLGRRIARWKRAEVLEWLESRPRGTRLTSGGKTRQQVSA